MSWGEKEAIQHGLVKYIGDLARSSDLMTIAIYFIWPINDHPHQWELLEMYTRHSSDPKSHILGQKFDILHQINFEKFPLKHKDSMRSYMDEMETYWDCFIVGWTGDHGKPPATIDWDMKQCMLTQFANAFPHKSFIKTFWAVGYANEEDTDEDEEKMKKRQRRREICDFVWDMMAWH